MRTRQGIEPSQKWDLIVIGGGIVGCSTAFYAARLGLRVLIVERDTPGSGQSGRNLGFVRQQGRDFRELPSPSPRYASGMTLKRTLAGRSAGLEAGTLF
ncbi:FAD-dependent oxidoreductase (plasmid) [Sinorhizobium meliloti]|nr:FAD-dependent oxidoreductase [Sinorhizobium meliloti]